MVRWGGSKIAWFHPSATVDRKPGSAAIHFSCNVDFSIVSASKSCLKSLKDFVVFVDVCQEGKYIDYLVIHETKTELLSQNNIKREYKNVLNLKTHSMSIAFYIFKK